MGKLDYLNVLLHKFGFEMLRYNKGTSGTLRRKALLERYGVDLAIDVGANVGSYGKEIRENGYIGQIASFEPLSLAFKKLEEAISGDSKWKAYNFALGIEIGAQIINISQNLHSSSILEILETHTKAEQTASYINKEEIQIKTLDSMFGNIRGEAKEIYLKIDTQGFELNVLKGAVNSLKFIDTIQVEMSLQPLYAGQPLYDELFNFLRSYEYDLIDVEPGFADLNTGTLLQFDGVFRKRIS
jgi:FkbM family methyltransferase